MKFLPTKAFQSNTDMAVALANISTVALVLYWYINPDFFGLIALQVE